MGQQHQWDIVSGVGITALGVALARAAESVRADRLIDDPFAGAFFAAAEPMIPEAVRSRFPTGQQLLHHPLVVQTSHYMGLRSRVLDEHLLAACRSGVRQVVVLAAGLDARAYRLTWPEGVRLFELDQPEVLAFKDSVLRAAGATPGCQRTTIAVDLRDDWPAALVAGGFVPQAPTAWLIEGLLSYLPADAERRLFDAVHRLSAAGSHLAAEYVTDVAAMADRSDVSLIGSAAGLAVGDLFDREPRPAPGVWLSDAGWTVAVEPAPVAAERYGRDLAGSPGSDLAGSLGRDLAGSPGSDLAGSPGSDLAGAPGRDRLAGSPGSDRGLRPTSDFHAFLNANRPG